MLNMLSLNFLMRKKIRSTHMRGVTIVETGDDAPQIDVDLTNLSMDDLLTLCHKCTLQEMKVSK